ncbi:hypothetical protein ACKKBG_A16290 [Auxenochlorella protothecoides x Auxenochlorella symbiontica]
MKRSNCYLDYADLKPAVGGAGRTSCAHTSARIDIAGFLREVVLQPARLPEHPLLTPAPAADRPGGEPHAAVAAQAGLGLHHQRLRPNGSAAG